MSHPHFCHISEMQFQKSPQKTQNAQVEHLQRAEPAELRGY